MSQIGNLTLDPSAPFFILGPCALESEEFAWQMARSLKEIAERTGIQFIFKASYDKANRTSVDSFRGPGVVEGCRIRSPVQGTGCWHFTFQVGTIVATSC